MPAARGWREVVVYAGYLAACVTLPGVTVWRLLWSGRDDSWLERVVFGTLVGFCVQPPVYLAGVVIGFPRLPAALPVAAGAFWSVRAVRRRRRAPEEPRARPLPAVLSGAIAAGTVHAVVWIAGIGWLLWPFSHSAPQNPNGDEPHMVALITELRHHFPPQMPSMAGQPLEYHWYANALMSAATWLTGLQPAPILDRLWLFPMLFLLIAATGLTAYRITGSALCGAAASIILGLVGNFSPFPEPYAISRFDETFLSYGHPLSPSLDLGTAMLLLAVRIIVQLLRARRVGRGDVGLLVLSCAMLTSAKSTGLPLLLAGLVGALIMQLGIRRRLHRRLVGCLGLVLVALAFAQVVLYGGNAQGTSVDAWHLTSYVADKLVLAGNGGPGRGSAGVLLVVSWLSGAVAAVLLLGRRTRADPVAALLVAAGVGGTVAALALAHPHFGEFYFIQAAVPLFAIAAAYGLFELSRRLPPRYRLPVFAGGAAAGVAASLMARVAAVPLPRPDRRRPTWGELLTPYAITVAVLVAAGIAVWAWVRWRSHGAGDEHGRHRMHRRTAVVGLLIVAVGCLGLPRPLFTAMAVSRQPWQNVAKPVRATAVIGLGGLAAATWLRRNSDVDDLVATNAHYRRPGDRSDNRAFWIAAHTERRVLEGWGYTAPVTAEASRRGVPSFVIGFADPAFLQTNDAAFRNPTAASVGTLRDRYQVRWLFVDTRVPNNLAALTKVARLRFRAGDYAVLELTG